MCKVATEYYHKLRNIYVSALYRSTAVIFNVQTVAGTVNGSFFKLAVTAFEITVISGSCLARRHNEMFQLKVSLFPLVGNGV